MTPVYDESGVLLGYVDASDDEDEDEDRGDDESDPDVCRYACGACALCWRG